MSRDAEVTWMLDGMTSERARGFRLFRGTLDGSVSGGLVLLLLDPAFAACRRPGRPGANPRSNDVLARIFLPDGTTVPLAGLEVQGSVRLVGQGSWILEGALASGELVGRLGGPRGFSAARATLFCREVGAPPLLRPREA